MTHAGQRIGAIGGGATGGVVSVRVLGGFEVVRAGHALAHTDWGRLSAERLVKLLAVIPGHRLTRERAAELLWPEASPASTSANLRKAIHFARRALADPTLWVVDGRFVGLDPARLDLDLDRLCAAFDTCAASRHGGPAPSDAADPADAAVTTILDLGAEDLLPDDTDEDWLIAPRERLVGRWLRIAISAAEAARDRGRMTEAHEIVERILDRDPSDEAAHRLAIELYAAEGRHHAVRRQYESCRRALLDLLDSGPSAETEAVYRRAERAATQARATAAPGPRLIGRRTELERMERVLDTVTAGRASTIVLRGPAGIGKSRLLRELATLARASGWHVVEWQASETMRGAPYAPFRVALGRQLQAGVVDTWPEPSRSAVMTIVPEAMSIARTADSAVTFADRWALDLALVDAVGRIAGSRPLCLAIDDLPVLDPASIGLLAAITGGLSEVPILVATAHRDDEPINADVRAFVGEALRHGGLEIAVPPLGPRDVERLIPDHLGGDVVESSLARRIHELADGNPLFCLELAREGRDRGSIAVERGRWKRAVVTTHDPVPASARALVEERLARLPGSTRTLLFVAAELPAPIPYASLTAALGVDGASIVGDLDAALASGLLVERAGGYAFGHPLYRQATLDTAGPPGRASVELAIAAAIGGVPPVDSPIALVRAADDGRDPSLVAEHALHALELGRRDAGPLAVAFAFRAAEEQRRLFDRRGAIRLLERGLAAWRDLPAETRAEFDASGALVGLADLLRLEGDEAAAETRFREAISTARDAEELARAYDAFQWLPYGHGDFAAARALLDEGLACLPAAAEVQRARLRRDVGWCFVREGRIDDGIGLLEESAAMLEAADARGEAMKTLDLLGDALGVSGRYEEALTRLRRSLAIAIELADLRGELLAHLHLGGTLRQAGRPADGRPHLAWALESARLGGDRYVESVVAMLMAEVEEALGHPAEAVELLERELALLEAIGGNPRNEAVAHAHLALLARGSGDLAATERASALARAAAARTEDPAFATTIEWDLALDAWSEARY